MGNLNGHYISFEWFTSGNINISVNINTSASVFAIALPVENHLCLICHHSLSCIQSNSSPRTYSTFQKSMQKCANLAFFLTKGG